MTIESLAAALLYLCLPWVAIDLVSKLLQKYSRRVGGSSILGVRKRLTTSALARDKQRTVWFTRGLLWIKVETTILNSLPNRLLKRFARHEKREDRPLSSGHNSAAITDIAFTSYYRDNEGGSDKKRKRQRAVRYLELFYDAGIVFAGLAFFGSTIFLIWSASDLIGQISQLGEGTKTNQAHVLEKREVEQAASAPATQSSWSPNLVPLVSRQSQRRWTGHLLMFACLLTDTWLDSASQSHTSTRSSLVSHSDYP
jgi:hypothetical protein